MSDIATSHQAGRVWGILPTDQKPGLPHHTWIHREAQTMEMYHSKQQRGRNISWYFPSYLFLVCQQCRLSHWKNLFRSQPGSLGKQTSRDGHGVDLKANEPMTSATDKNLQNTVMHHIMTFQSTMDCVYDNGPKQL